MEKIRLTLTELTDGKFYKDGNPRDLIDEVKVIWNNKVYNLKEIMVNIERNVK